MFLPQSTPFSRGLSHRKVALLVFSYSFLSLVKLSVRLTLIKTLPQQSRFLFNADNIASLAQTFIIILCDIVRALNKGLGFSIYCSICFVY